MSRPSTDHASTAVVGHFEGDTVDLPIADDHVKDASARRRRSARPAWSLTADALPAMQDGEVPESSRANGLKTLSDLPSLNADDSVTASHSQRTRQTMRSIRSRSTAGASGRTRGKDLDFIGRVCATLPRVPGHVIRPQRACSSAPSAKVEAWGEATVSSVPTSEELPPADKMQDEWRRTFGKIGVSKTLELLPLDEPLMPTRPPVPNRYPGRPFRRLTNNPQSDGHASDASEESDGEIESRSGTPTVDGNSDLRIRELPPDVGTLGGAPRNLPTIANLPRTD
mmetsp:Transcript_28237/g.80984  ORF Transcript_28237/g.80984 Transcript_28237/m.80984 type:complete len:283 (-) Transcript_28237:77-925(-)